MCQFRCRTVLAILFSLGLTAAPPLAADDKVKGGGGGILRLTYREFTGEDLARPAFTQEVTYDLAPNGPTEIPFKGAHITVLSAGNAAVRYTVETSFKY